MFFVLNLGAASCIHLDANPYFFDADYIWSWEILSGINEVLETRKSIRIPRQTGYRAYKFWGRYASWGDWMYYTWMGIGE